MTEIPPTFNYIILATDSIQIFPTYGRNKLGNFRAFSATALDRLKASRRFAANMQFVDDRAPKWFVI